MLQHSLPLCSWETEDADKRGFNQLERNVSGRTKHFQSPHVSSLHIHLLTLGLVKSTDHINVLCLFLATDWVKWIFQVLMLITRWEVRFTGPFLIWMHLDSTFVYRPPPHAICFYIWHALTTLSYHSKSSIKAEFGLYVDWICRAITVVVFLGCSGGWTATSWNSLHPSIYHSRLSCSTCMGCSNTKKTFTVNLQWAAHYPTSNYPTGGQPLHRKDNFPWKNSF